MGENKEELKKGFTTGSCSAAAAKAGAFMLLSGRTKESIEIETPAGIPYNAELLDITRGEDFVSCAVRKYSGDDPDITNGILIYVNTRLIPDGKQRVEIAGGKGVGVITRPGLDQPVGNAAINSVPRRMMEKEVREVMEIFDCDDSFELTVSVPEGEKIAEKTFNPKLGIEGGISIIGTTGIVEPMSTKAILDTIFVELRQLKEEGATVAVVTPGNYGQKFLFDEYGYDIDKAVKCSNFVGDTVDMVRKLGFEKMIFAGHAGKLVKVSGGIMNTHSKEADCRMELMAAAAARCHAGEEVLNQILDCVTTKEACQILKELGIERQCFKYIVDKIKYHLEKRAEGELSIESMIYMTEYGVLGKTDGAESLLEKVKENM